MKPQPWMKWYPADWRAHTKLKMCSLGARGLWIEMLGIMHEAEPYGHLLIDGAKPLLRDLAAIVGRPEKEVMTAYAELQQRGVFSITDAGVPYSRKMVRDKAKADLDRANGKHGGNPKIINQDNGGVNPPDNLAVNGGDKAHMPEARDSESEEKPEANASVKKGARHELIDLETWSPDDDDRQYALDQGRDPERILADIRSWAANQPPRKRSKPKPRAFWQGWCRRAADRGECGIQGQGQRQSGTRPASIAASVAAVIAQGEVHAGFRSDRLRGDDVADTES